MSLKIRDQQGRWRNKTVGFRVSPEEDALLERMVEISGLTKQEYLSSCTIRHQIVVHGNPRVYKALQTEINRLVEELGRLKDLTEITEDTRKLIDYVSKLTLAMKEETCTTSFECE